MQTNTLQIKACVHKFYSTMKNFASTFISGKKIDFSAGLRKAVGGHCEQYTIIIYSILLQEKPGHCVHPHRRQSQLSLQYKRFLLSLFGRFCVVPGVKQARNCTPVHRHISSFATPLWPQEVLSSWISPKITRPMLPKHACSRKAVDLKHVRGTCFSSIANCLCSSNLLYSRCLWWEPLS